MGQTLHGSAMTTEAVLRATQNSQASLWDLAGRHGINPKRSQNGGGARRPAMLQWDHRGTHHCSAGTPATARRLPLRSTRHGATPIAIMPASLRLAWQAAAQERDLSSEISFFNQENVVFVDDVGALAKKLQDPRSLGPIVEGGRRLVGDSFP